MTNPNPNRLALGLLVVLFLAVNLFTLHDGHTWGDDFAQLIRHSQNLLDGKPYASRILVEPWVISPPGFPLLMAPLVKFFGVNFKVLKLLNIGFWLGFVWFLYLLMHRRLGEDRALLGAAVFLFSPCFFTYKQNILSDIPFLFFTIAAIYCWVRYFEGPPAAGKPRSFWLACALALTGYAYLVRLAGLVLFAAVLIYIFLKEKDKRALWPVGGGLLALHLVQKIFGVGVAAYLKGGPETIGEWAIVGFKNISYVFKTIISFFIPPYIPTVVSFPLYPFLNLAMDIAAPLLFLAAVVVCGIRIFRKSIAFADLFFILYLLSVVFWPVEGGIRYVLPIVGLVFISIIAVLNFGKVSQVILIVLLLHNVFNIATYLNYNEDDISKKEVRELTQWMKEHTAPEENFMFFRARALGLLTDRLGAPASMPPEDARGFKDRLIRGKIVYLVKVKEFGNEDFPFLIGHDFLVEQVWENDAYRVLKIGR